MIDYSSKQTYINLVSGYKLQTPIIRSVLVPQQHVANISGNLHTKKGVRHIN